MKPIGLCGTGIELDGFISKCYESLSSNIDMYFFNEAKEITGAKDKQILVDKLHIDSVYENLNYDALMKKAKEGGVSGNLIEFEVSPTERGIIRYLPSYDWYLLATSPDNTGRSEGIDLILIIFIVIVIIIITFVIIIAKFQDFITRLKKSQEHEKEVQLKEKKLGERLFEEAQNLVVATKETAATSQDSSAAVKEIVATMEDSNVLSENISTKIKDVSSIANQTSLDVTEGVAQIEQNVAQLHEIFDANQQTIDGIKVLSEKIESIWDTVTLINNVADQAKIIAFNAELEASTAGEAGKSFRIVANEIRRLSDGIIDGTKEIKERITEIQHSSDSLILASESGTKKINEGYENAKNLGEKFASIKNSAEVTANSAGDITSIIQQQTTASEQILIALKQISAGVENFTVATDNISSSSEHIRAMSEAMNNSVQSSDKQKNKN
jgi:methyl-accepting chemotaxis protein